MEINEVTLFKLLIFGVCLVLMTIFVLKITIYADSTSAKTMCQLLISKPEVKQSLIIAGECPEGYYPNFGKFTDVKNEQKCCVMYNEK